MAEVLGKPVAAGDAEGGARSLGKAPCASWPRHRAAPMARRERGGFGQGGSPAPLARCSLPCPPKCKIRRRSPGISGRNSVPLLKSMVRLWASAHHGGREELRVAAIHAAHEQQGRPLDASRFSVNWIVECLRDRKGASVPDLMPTSGASMRPAFGRQPIIDLCLSEKI